MSTRALVADLLGYDPDVPQRPSVAEAAAACRPGQVLAAREGGDEVAVVRLVDGRTFVVEDSCPHDGGPLSSGWVDGDRLVCARHNWEIDPVSGQCDRRGACVASRALVALTVGPPARPR